jgi:pSer/pThr/pTyr-binding forkhead associated (FHA) protein
MAQVFISHSSRDAAFVLSHIKPALDRAGVDAWFSATDILFIELPSGPGFERLLRVARSATIGRADTADLQLTDDCISRRHARIAVLPADQAPFVTLSDLNSANGTFVNHDRILSEQRLQVGDLIELGNTRMQVRAIEGLPPYRMAS